MGYSVKKGGVGKGMRKMTDEQIEKILSTPGIGALMRSFGYRVNRTTTSNQVPSQPKRFRPGHENVQAEGMAVRTDVLTSRVHTVDDLQLESMDIDCKSPQNLRLPMSRQRNERDYEIKVLSTWTYKPSAGSAAVSMTSLHDDNSGGGKNKSDCNGKVAKKRPPSAFASLRAGSKTAIASRSSSKRALALSGGSDSDEPLPSIKVNVDFSVREDDDKFGRLFTETRRELTDKDTRPFPVV
jgi:hypothetical protein